MIPENIKAGIEELSREELIALVYELLNKLRELEEKLRLKRTPTTSKNSSLPPSRDFKVEKPKKRRRHKKVGAKAGHRKHARALVDNPDKVIEAYVDNCQNCHVNLLEQVPVRTIRRQITELPEIKPVVIETRPHEVVCPCCGESQRGKLPEGLEAWRQFGPRLEATVTYLHHEHHVGFERLLPIPRFAHDLEICFKRQPHPQPLTDGGLVVCDDDPDHGYSIHDLTSVGIGQWEKLNIRLSSETNDPVFPSKSEHPTTHFFKY